LAVVMALWAAGSAEAQTCVDTGVNAHVGFDPLSGSTARDANCACTNQCTVGFRCYPPVLGGASYELLPAGCNPKIQGCTVRATVPTDFPGNSQSLQAVGGGAHVDWLNSANVNVGTCGRIGFEIFGDKGNAWIEVGGFSCAGSAAGADTYTILAQVCTSGCSSIPPNQRQTSSTVDLTVPGLQALFCKRPPTYGCPGDGPAGTCCLGPTGGSSPAGGGVGTGGEGTGPGAHLFYLAGGAGNPEWPGAAVWSPTLGRGWSHSYAERIVLDADDAHVWLITRHATYREFSGLSAGVYAQVQPRDEYRKLVRTGTGWELRGLDGTVEVFDAGGLWSRTTDRNGNATLGTYAAGRLATVSFPDGRSETFTYQPGGKLATITETGVGGTASRVWTYTWTGDNLTRIVRPDGTGLELRYDDARFPSFMTRRDLVGTDLSHRVEAAWEHDAAGNVAKTWKGDPVSNGPNAVELYTFVYTNPVAPSQAVVTDPLSLPTTYTIARDAGSNKPKITKIQGDCPVCGTGPNSVITYGDAANPLLPTRIVDGRGLETQTAYGANGRTTSRTEAAGTPRARTTTWQYGNPAFPGFPTRTDVPSTSGGSALRSTILAYNAAGDLTTRTVQGAESGGSFSFATTTTFNAAGQPLTIDPPGHGTADVTTYTYDPARGNLLPLTRTDPLIGATSFAYDAFNRRTSTTDPNGVQTATAYDPLNRVTTVTQKGAIPADDLATSYVYTPFGDLFRTVLPRGNLIEYGYDPAGRLVTVERKPDAATHGERTLFTLDGYGHRTKEELQSWNGTAWVTRSSTSYVYSSRCHLDKAIYPDGSATEYAYDCDGNLERVWDANHPRGTNPTPTQAYAYDELNRLASVTQPWTGGGDGSAMTAYGYDVQDHLTQVTDAEGNVTNYLYSDRDLMTSQVSPASGATTYAFDEHGELTAETDERGITMTRTLDVLDRATAVTYPDVTQNTIYTYDDPLVAFSKGRLTRIARNGVNVDYRYDRFGRLLQDGELTYGWDANGNPATLGYPGSVTAVYGYDFADRPATLLARRPSQPDRLLVTAASYQPAGPLSSLALGNGLTETRTFTNRYFPSSITLGGASNLLSWTYTTDNVGNISGITDTLSSANNRTYGYQDIHYFLTQGNGPWGPRSWTYDKIGNRLTEIRGTVTDTYAYGSSTGGGHSPILTQVQLGAGGTRTYQFGPAGQLERMATGADATVFTNDAAGHLAALERTAPRTGTAFRYDGRGYLTLADANALPFLDGFETGNICGWSAALGIIAPPVCTAPPPPAVHPTYSSEGLLHALQKNASPDRTLLFHFTGRPVAQLDLTGSVESWRFLTTDHLGTPIAATSTAGALQWQGGFEPFGADWSGAAGVGVFLRFPGQWEDNVWSGATDKLSYNLFRWYDQATGKYASVDPMPMSKRDSEAYSFGLGNPLSNTDSLGLQALPIQPVEPQPIPRTFPRPVPPSAPQCPLPEEAPGPGILTEILTAPVTAFLALFFNASPANAPTLTDSPPGKCCEGDDSDDDDHCDAQLAADMHKCRQWYPFGINQKYNELYLACKAQAFTRYAECRRFGRPLSPLSPHRFQY
jgi:RHS repeat-associated protein